MLGELRLFSNEIPRVVVKSLLSLVHKMCWLDKALCNFKIALLLKRNLHEDFRSIQKQDVGPSPGEFRGNVFFSALHLWFVPLC